MIMKKSIAWIIGTFWAAGLTAQIMVLPLKVDTQNHTSYQWLGKAVSYYLISGFQLNSLPVIDEEEIQLILNRNLIRFPFAITKATAMVLARENQADRLLWGEIFYNSNNSSPITVKLSLIDVKGRIQKHLPVFKGNFKNIYQIQEELLKEVIKVIAKEKTGIRFPELNMVLPDYEKFIKSLLLADAGKKLDLLLSFNEKDKRSDFLNFALAKIYLDKSDFVNSESCLNRIANDSLFKDKKDFLLALVNFANGNADVALNQFIQLQRQNIYAVATNNNLGVIYLKKNDYSTAEKCLQYALYLKKDPEIYSNLIVLLKAMGKNNQALEELNRALQMFPDDERLLKQFAAFLNASENRELLTQAFRNFVPFPPQSEASLSIQPLLKNPFQIKPMPEVFADSNSYSIEARNLFLENDYSGAMQKAEEAMEVNPFLYGNHHLLALLFLQKKNYFQAVIYAQSALFLKENLDNFLLQIKIYQACKNSEKFKETLALALQKFPQSAELLELKSRGH
jgi:tetratricopeptide (TPR) repeat protein